MEDKRIDLRVTKTRSALHKAFTELLEEKNFEEITVVELCERAMIRRTTFYKHYTDKNDYFRFYICELRDSFASELPPDVSRNSPTEYITYMSRHLYLFVQTHENLVSHIVDSEYVNMLFELLYEIVSNEISDAMSKSRYSWEQRSFTSAFYASGLLSTVRKWVNSHRNITEDQFVSEVVQLMDMKFSEIEFK